MSYNIREIRLLLQAAFTAQDFERLCFDKFDEVYQSFTQGQDQSDRVISLINYTRTHGSLDDLLQKIKAERPQKYAEFESRLQSSQGAGNELLRGGRCYLITPGTNKLRSNNLFKLLQPILRDQLHQNLERSESNERGTNFERLANADLIIADVSEKDPRVMYEIAVAQCMGQPVFVIGDSGNRYGDLPFDVIPLNLGYDEEIRDLIPEQILKIKQASQTLAANPIIKAFNAPLTELSPSSGLVLGYYDNFVHPVALSICEVVLGISPWKIEIAAEERRNSDWKEIRFNIVLPKNLDWTSDDFILEHLIKPDLIRVATIKMKPRDRPLYAFPGIGPDSFLNLADPFPNFMKVLAKGIDDRFDTRQPAERGPQWHKAAEWEIEIVRRRLITLIQKRSQSLDNAKGNKTLQTKSVVQILRWNQAFPELEEKFRK